MRLRDRKNNRKTRDALCIKKCETPEYTGVSGRATDGIRTRGLHLGKVALYQLSYYRMGFSFSTQDFKPYCLPLSIGFRFTAPLRAASLNINVFTSFE